MPKKPTQPKQTMWERIKAGMATIGDMVDTLTARTKKKPTATAKIRTQRKATPTPQPSPEQQEYLDSQK